MSESDAKIQELSGRIKSLEVEASDLAARNSLLQRVAELQRESSSAAPQSSGDGLADMQVGCCPMSVGGSGVHTFPCKACLHSDHAAHEAGLPQLPHSAHAAAGPSAVWQVSALSTRCTVRRDSAD
jgi:hypothetical protein